ncbi:MAG TPA: bifunctional riboflavin kinase/FAD synthetase [Actinobacteria bacterium]|nr:bifunctional riboflavin kinase/FAD synthetase [Actinomycetota bacterium]
MRVLRGAPETWEAPEGGTALAIGVFDGVHLGHRAVFAALADVDGPVRGALTFDPNPAAVLGGDPPPQLTTLERRIELIGEAGLDLVAVATFDDELRRSSPEEFVRRHLVAGLDVRCVAVGAGFRFGHRAAGTTETLAELGERYGFETRVVPILEIDGLPVRSSVIRELLARGEVERAATLLGRPHEIEGTVVPGDGRGRTIGIPTANLSVTDRLAVPARGVYAVKVELADGRRLGGVANVGVRPTFDGGDLVVEVHVFDLDEDLYGLALRVRWLARLRGERRFPDVEALVRQIRRDVAVARELVEGR